MFDFFMGRLMILIVAFLTGVLLFLAVEACGQDIYGSLLPSTVTRSVIGFQQYGNVLQLNPISRNVRPYDTQPVRIYTRQADDIRPKKKHPEDNICLHFSVKIR
jgi:hypothetical protein